MADLPVASREVVLATEQEYKQALKKGHLNKEVIVRYLWALVHSDNYLDVQLGLDLCEEYITQADESYKRDVLYFKGVALHKQGKEIVARRHLAKVLKEYPNFYQAQQLYDVASNEVVRDGLVGVGIAGAFLGAAGLAVGIIAASVSRRHE